MSGSLTELAAIGAQEAFLSIDPEITFFKGEYKRHSNFAVEPLKNYFSPELRLGGTGICTIERNGDLVHEQLLVFTLPDISSHDHWEYVPEVAHVAVESIALDIGGHVFVEHTGDYLAIEHELMDAPGKEVGRMVGKEVVSADGSYSKNISPGAGAQEIMMPLRFWFNKELSQVLPLIALAYHEVKIRVKLAPMSKLVREKNGQDVVMPPELAALGLVTTQQPHILTEYIYLDDEERLGFANSTHEYLIEQVQYNGPHMVSAGATETTVRLDINHPVHELIWVAQADSMHSDALDTGRDYFKYELVDNVAPVSQAQLMLNGHSRFGPLPGFYFHHVQPQRLHSRIPLYQDGRYIYCWNFGRKPEDHKPSGSLNFSRIDTANLRLHFTQAAGAGQVRVYARSRNIVRIRSGLASVRFAS